jgi:aspartyl protease family protein
VSCRLFILRSCLPIVLAFFSFHADAAVKNVEVLALFKGAALLKIDGNEHLLKAGKKSPEGVLLISATTREAVVEINGQRKNLGLTQSISGIYEQPEYREYTVPMNVRGQYVTTASINGQIIEVQVDTGANVVALSRRHAERLGIQYRRGVRSRVSTASGVADSWQITLNSVDVGGIKVPNVPASVVDADYPVMVLLGMTYLEHVEIRKQGDSLYLKQRY